MISSIRAAETTRKARRRRRYNIAPWFVCSYIEKSRNRADPAQFANTVLAHVLAHEITHVLEGVARHSDTGIMKAVWSPADYRQMKFHPLPFAPEDVDLIRDAIANRIQAGTAPMHP